MTVYDAIGVQAATILLPRPGIDLTKWAVIACDQFTSQPAYWEKVKEVVGEAPSTFNLILPEAFLGKPEEAVRIQGARQFMRTYLEDGLLTPHEGLIYVERRVDGKTRKGLMLALDLERYDYHPGSQSLVRATEGTILERLPPRMKMRECAPLEIPHILVLIDDPQHTVIEPIAARKSSLPALYDFDLMLDSGHLSGYSAGDPGVEKSVMDALMQLAQVQGFQHKYGVGPEKNVLLFAVGDGNHSLATAKAIWEKTKAQGGVDLAKHPGRYALVEIENVHDEALSFAPIHRVLFGVKSDPVSALQAFYPGRVTFQACAALESLAEEVSLPTPGQQRIGLLTPGDCGILNIIQAPCNLPVGTLQTFLDHFLKTGRASAIDYLHGDEAVFSLAQSPGNAGFLLPAMSKSDLFKTVILDGALPRKTFSMGEAREKRFYMECRRIC